MKLKHTWSVDSVNKENKSSFNREAVAGAFLKQYSNEIASLVRSENENKRVKTTTVSGNRELGTANGTNIETPMESSDNIGDQAYPLDKH